MTIEIEDLHFQAILGILKEERENPQKIIVHALFEYDFTQEEFVDYAKVATFIQNHLQEKKFYLIEDALHSLVENLKVNFPSITYLKLKISKPEILSNCLVSALIEKNY